MSYLLHFVDHHSCSWYEFYPKRTWLFILTRLFCFLPIWHRKLTRIISASKFGHHGFRMGLGTFSYYFSRTNFWQNQRTKLNFFSALCSIFEDFSFFSSRKSTKKYLFDFQLVEYNLVRLHIILLNQNWHNYIILDKNRLFPKQ